MEYIEKLVTFFKKDEKRTKMLMIAGFLGILLIFLSSLFGFGEKKISFDEERVDLEAYRADLEKRLEAFVSCIEGAGEARVFLSFLDDGETCYLKEEESDYRKDNDGDGENQQISVSEKVFDIDGENGKTALAVRYRTPEIGGVSIICEGGDSPLVETRVTSAVATALGLSYSKIYVSKMES